MTKPARSVSLLLVFGSLLSAAAAGSPESAATDCSSASDGTSCDDANACTLGEDCRGGACLAPVSFSQPAGSPIPTGTNPRSVAAADWNGDGKLDLAIANYGAGNVTILLGNGSGGFSAAAGSPVVVGTGPAAIAAGDWNGDGRKDLVVANALSHNVSVLVGNGLGGFAPAAGSPIATWNLPFSLAVGKVNGDGAQDLVVASFSSANVTVLLGNGSGGFAPASGSPFAVGPQPVAVALGDVNGDGRLDLATANTASGNVTVLLGNGSGGFSAASGSPFAVGTTPESVLIADLSGDARLDLAVANAASNNVTILLGDGAGGFSAAAGSPVSAGTTPTSIAAADLNGDGRLDLAVANRNGNDVTLLLGKGSGGFAPAAGSPVAAGANTISVAAGDLNADGKPDLAVANFDSSNVTVHLNGTTFAADGTACDSGNACTLVETCRSGKCVAPVSFTESAGSPVAIVTGSYSAAAGDWNGDGTLDLAVANYDHNTVTIVLGNGSGGFTPAAGSPVAVGIAPTSVASGDWNEDGKLDLAVTNSASHDVSILLGNGAGGFSPSSGSPAGPVYNPWDVSIGDVNGDGSFDLAVAGYSGNEVAILLGNGAGTFTHASGSPIPLLGGPISIALGDLDGDDKLDLVVARYDDDVVSIFQGNGAGGFTQLSSSPIATGNGPRSVVLADVNQDGKLDLEVASFDDSNVAILLGNGVGGFSPAVGSPVTSGTGPLSVLAADLNGDGRVDLATTNHGSNDLTILLGNGSGGFHAGSPITGSTQPSHAVAGDVNGDGKLDLAVTNAGVQNVRILLGASCRSGQCRTPAFTESALSPVSAGTTPFFVTVGDWNGDGKLDQAVANYGSADVTILLGNGAGGASQAAGSPVAVGQVPVSIASGDWNGDGKLDLAVANYGTANVTILLGDGTGGFSPASGSPVAAASGPRSIAAGDLNGDGKLDLAVANYFGFDVTILLGNGTGGFTPASPVPTEDNPAALAIGDLDGDGKLDLAVANYGDLSASIFLGNGSGAFSQASGSPIPVGSGPDAIAIGDLDLDGRLDVAVANIFDHNVRVLLGAGSGTFIEASGSPLAVGNSPTSLAIADLNQDGRPDLVSAVGASSGATILLGDGSGGFVQAPGSPVPTGVNPRSVAIADLNADGRLDLVVANSTSNHVTQLLAGTVLAPNGTACDDASACTTNDACTGGACAGTPGVPPLEVDSGVRLSRPGGNAVVAWNLATGASSSSILRGAQNALPVGPGGGDEVCLASGIPANTLVWPDAASPAAGTGFWYLVRGDNACGAGPYGFQGKNGVPTVARISTTCP